MRLKHLAITQILITPAVAFHMITLMAIMVMESTSMMFLTWEVWA